MDIFIIALLIFIGLVMVILEVFFLPGITIAGISAVLFFVGAVFYAFMQLGEFAGYITIAVSVIVTIVGIVIFISSVAPTLVSDQIKVGDEGVTLSRLNPMGSVLINDVTVEARTREDFIDEDTPVVVEKVDRTTVIVQKKENEK